MSEQFIPESPPPHAPRMITADMLGVPAPAPIPETRIDFERGMSPLPKLAIALIVSVVAIFAWELAVGALESEEAIVRAGALSRKHVEQGEVWRIATSAFLHGGFDHLIGNCLMLYVLGMACEHAFGSTRTAIIYTTAGVAGATFSLLFTRLPSVGASGAIFGLAGAVIVFLYRYQSLFFLRDKRIGFVLLLWAIYTIGIGVFQTEIDNFCHIGGFLGGVICGVLIPRRGGLGIGRNESRRQQV